MAGQTGSRCHLLLSDRGFRSSGGRRKNAPSSRLSTIAADHDEPSPPSFWRPLIARKSTGEHDPSGRACCGMQGGTSRVLSRLPRSFSARVASTNVLRGLPAAVRSQKDLGSRGLGVRSASTDQGRLILRREVASTLASWNYRGLLLLRDADGRSLFDSLVHFLGAEQRPDRRAREPSHVGTQLRGGCRDFVGVADNRVGGGRAVIEKPEFELSPDRFDKFGDTCLERCRRLFLQIFQTFGGGQGRSNQVSMKVSPVHLTVRQALEETRSTVWTW